MRQILVEQHSGSLLNITWFEFRLTVHFTFLTMKTLICSFLSLFFLVPEIINTETPTKYEALDKGILFHKESQILLAEKFVNVEFLVPFPQYDFVMKQQIEDMLEKLATMWTQPSILCPVNFSEPFNSSNKPFNLDWMLSKITNETKSAENEVKHMRNVTAKFLNPEEENGQRSRQKRAAPVAAAAAVAGLSLFGSLGVSMASSEGCGITGLFGKCQNYGRKNAENIARLNEYASVLTDYVLEVESASNEKFFLISNEIAKVSEIQQEMQDNQNKNWKVVQDQFDIFEKIFHLLRDCTQMLFSNQQLNFNFDTVASLLSILYADIKGYRSALYAYSINLLNSIPILLDKRLPMSLVPHESLLAVLDSVHDSQKHSTDRLSLAIPMKDLMSYYDAKLVYEIATVEQGLLLTLAIPLASRQTSFHVYSAHVIPMPQQDPKEALQWIIEGPYLAISQNSMETSTLTQQQLDNCLGSSTYRICHETMETHLAQSSCLATLYFHATVVALSVCQTEKVMLPTPETARNLGYGIWLIMSAKPFTWREYNLNDASLPTSEEKEGCRLCIITLQCGVQLISKHIKIRPDLSSCQTIPATRIDVKLADPLQHLISSLPEIEKLPYFTSKTDANIELFQQLRVEMISSTDTLKQADLDKIAAPLVHKMQLLKPSLVDKLESYVPIKLSLTLTITVFIGNLLLHILVMYLYHKIKFFQRITPNFMKFSDGKIPLKPVVSVTNSELTKIQSLDHKM